MSVPGDGADGGTSVQQTMTSVAAGDGDEADELVAGTRQPMDVWWLVSSACLAALLGFFAWVHFLQWRETGRPIGLGLMFQESVAAALFVVRRKPAGSSREITAWVASIVGSFGMLAARPVGHVAGTFETVLTLAQFTGAALSAVSLLWLGRSFGLVAANRGIKTAGPYKIVRHPAYATYFITHLAYLLENISPWNTLVFLTVYTAQFVRIWKEEELLAGDPAYQAYRQRVRFRLIPFVY